MYINVCMYTHMCICIYFLYLIIWIKFDYLYIKIKIAKTLLQISQLEYGSV